MTPLDAICPDPECPSLLSVVDELIDMNRCSSDPAKADNFLGFRYECIDVSYFEGRIGRSSAPRSERRIQPGQSRLLLLMVLATRPTLAEVPLTVLSLNEAGPDFSMITFLAAQMLQASGTRKLGFLT